MKAYSIYIVLLCGLLMFSLVNAEEWGYNYIEGDLNIQQAINYSEVNVNNSDFLDGLTWEQGFNTYQLWSKNGNDVYYNDGDIGIGTDSPLKKLHVAGNLVYSQSQSGQLYVGGTDTNKRLMIGYDTTSNYAFLEPINFGVAYSNLILNPTGGRIGIGNKAPNSLLSVSDGDAYGIATGLTFGDGDTGIYEFSDDRIRINVGGSYFADIQASGYSQQTYIGGVALQNENPTSTNPVYAFYGDGDSGITRSGANEIGLITGGTNRLTIDSSGKIGLGTTSPSAQLHLSQTYNPKIRLTESVAIGGNSWDLMTGVTARDQFAIYQNSSSSYRFLINQNGNIGINTTTPQNTLNILGDLNVTGIIYQSTTSKAYAQTAYHNETDPLVIDLIDIDVYYNITGLHLDYNNSIYMNGQATINKTGMYTLDGSVGFSGGNSGDYRFNLFVNNLAEHACGSPRTTSTSQKGSLSINCLVYLEQGDIVNMRIKDIVNPVQDVNIYSLTFTMVEI